MTESVCAFVTYCSADKDRSPALLPAISRYRSSRIKVVKEMADSKSVRFFVLSGEFGLLRPTELIPYYDHLLVAKEVDKLAIRVAAQMKHERLAKITFFINAPKMSPKDPYVQTAKRACRLAGANFRVNTLEAKESMSDWQTAMTEARSAKQLLLQHRAEGEKRFEELLESFGEDGMIYFIRGEAYEALGQTEAALNDYRLAEILFPYTKYQEQARQAAVRIETRLHANAARIGNTELEQVLKIVPAKPVVEPVEDAVRFVESNPSAAVGAFGERAVRSLIMYLERANQLRKAPGSSWRSRTKGLLDKKIISKIRMLVAALNNIFKPKD